MASKTNQKSALHRLLSGCVLVVLLMAQTFNVTAEPARFAPAVDSMPLSYLLPVTVKGTRTTEPSPHLEDLHGDETPPSLDTVAPPPPQA